MNVVIGCAAIALGFGVLCLSVDVPMSKFFVTVTVATGFSLIVAGANFIINGGVE